jgi:hypothetical protein
MTKTSTGPVDRQHVRAAFRVFVQENIPVVLWGAPGVGKTQAVRDFVVELDWPLYEIIPATRNPDDFGGYPVPDNGCVRLRPIGDWLDFVKRVEASNCKKGILFLDEVGQCTIAVQNALLRVVLDRVVGEFVLPPGVRVVCAANPADQAGGWELTSAFSNRLAHLDWPSPTVEEWSDWLAGLPLPAEGAETAQRARHLVTHFLAARPGLLLSLPAPDAERGRAWPSPRSWHRCVEGLAGAIAAHPESVADMGAAVAAATVGWTAAGAFAEMLRGIELADPEKMLADPAAWGALIRARTEAGRLDLVWHGLVAVAVTVLSKLEHGRVPEARWKAAWELHRVAREACAGGAAVAALARPLAKAALPARGGLPNGPAYELHMPPEAEAVHRLLEIVDKGIDNEGDMR